MSQQDWFVIRDGKETGPFTAQRLREMAASGKLQPDDKVRRGDMKTATKASAIKGLFTSVEPVAARVTPPPTPSVATAQPSNAQKMKLPSKKVLVIASAVAGACLLLCCGGVGLVGMFGSRTRNAASDNLAGANSGSTKGVSGSSSSDQVIVVDTPLMMFPESVTQNPFQLSADGNYLLANGWAVWNIKTGKKLQSPEYFLRSRLSPSGTRLAALQLGNRKSLFIFSLDKESLVVQQKIELGHRDCFGPWWSEDEKRVAVTCRGPIFQSTVDEPPEDQDGFIVTLGEGKPQVARFTQAGCEPVYPDPYFSADGKVLIVTMGKPSEPNKHKPFAFDAGTGKLVDQAPKQEPSKDKWELRLVPNDDGRIEVWRVADNTLTAVLGKPDGLNRPFRAITPDGRFVASAQHEKRGIEIWDIGSGQKVTIKDYKQSLASGARPDYLKTKAPPINDATYDKIRVGMTTLEVWKLVGGQPYDEKSGLHEEGTDWIAERTEFYHSKDHPGSRIVLMYRGKGSAPPLIKKSITR
jgi:hypothetical protein